jgi:hypothetical protein
MANPSVAPSPVEKKIKAKWGGALTESGWTAIPNVIIQRQKALGLTPLDLSIILQLLAYWWDAGNLPHPSKKAIAAAIGVDPRTVQKRIAAMEAARFVKRIARRSSTNASSTNLYDFSGLIHAAQPFATEELEEIKLRKNQQQAKLTRKRPRLSVVRGEDTK